MTGVQTCALPICKVDVNVHPTKSEVKFSEEKKVFDCVYYAVLSTINASSAAKTAEISLSPSTKKAIAPKADFYKKMSAEEFRASQKSVSAPTRSAAVQQTRLNMGDVSKALFGEEKPLPPKAEATKITLRSPAPEYKSSPLVPRPEIPVIKSEAAPVPAPVPAPAPASVPAPAKEEEKPLIPDYRLIGEALNTYIIVESEGSMLLIDKHAAHERIIFDRLKKEDAAMSQSLLLPVTWRPDPESLELMEANASVLEKAGFEIEPYGAREVIIRAVPADTDGSEIAMLEDILSAIVSGKTEDPTEKIYHTIACKAAIKAGWKTDKRELEVLVEKVLSGEVRYCPHGRPVSVSLTRAELDKFFKRIV